MAILSGLISAEMPAKLIARRKDINIESAAYDIIRQDGYTEGREEGRGEAIRENARNLIRLGILTDEQIAQVTGLSVRDVVKMKENPEK